MWNKSVYVQEAVVRSSTRCIQAMERRDVESFTDQPDMDYRARFWRPTPPRTTLNNPYHLLPSLVGLECEASPPLSLYLLFHFAECFANLCWPLFLSAKGFVVRSVKCVCKSVQYMCVNYSYCFVWALDLFLLDFI